MLKGTLLAVLSFCLAGCSTTQPIRAWQERLTDFTMKQDGGDLNVLRESAELRSSDTARPAQIRFDHDDISTSGLGALGGKRDTHGVMVGQHAGGNHPTFYFLVGVMDRSSSGRTSEVEDIRLVSCTIRNGNHHWETSDPNPDALKQYLSSRPGNPNPAESARTSRSFPLGDDDFPFEVRDGNALVTDARSGAIWRLPAN